MLLVSSVTCQIWKKLVTITHAGVKEENNVAGKFCDMSNIEKNWSPVLILVLKRRIILLVGSVICKV